MAENGHQVWFTGTEDEASGWIDKIPKNERIHNTIGEFKLSELIGFIQQCDSIVACSTGPLHLGGILGIKAVGLFSPRRPTHPGRWKPLGPHVEAIVHDENCPKCAAGKACNCIEKITPEHIAGRFQKN